MNKRLVCKGFDGRKECEKCRYKIMSNRDYSNDIEIFPNIVEWKCLAFNPMDEREKYFLSWRDNMLYVLMKYHENDRQIEDIRKYLLDICPWRYTKTDIDRVYERIKIYKQGLKGRMEMCSDLDDQIHYFLLRKWEI